MCDIPGIRRSVVAIRWDKDMVTFYQRLKKASKPFKVAITAVMRKLLIVANTFLSEMGFGRKRSIDFQNRCFHYSK